MSARRPMAAIIAFGCLEVAWGCAGQGQSDAPSGAAGVASADGGSTATTSGGAPAQPSGGSSADTPSRGEATGGNASGGSAMGGSTPGGSATGGSATGGAALGGATPGGSATGGTATGGSAMGGSMSGGRATGGSAVGGNAPGGSAAGGAGTGGIATGGEATGGAAAGGATGGSSAVTTGLSVLTDTSRDGTIDASDAANHTDWRWEGTGAFLIANVDDDDKDGKADAADEIVNGTQDEKDLARVRITVGADALTNATSIAASVTSGATQVHLFENNGTTWKSANGALAQLTAETELGLEATRFADVDWDGFVTLKVDLLTGATAVASQSVKLRVAPWLMLPSCAKSEVVYIIGGGTGSAMRSGIDAVLQQKGLPACQTPTPTGQDQWYQDTMEIGYTQLPGSAPMHVVMTAQRGTVDEVAAMLLAPDFGFISIGEPRELGGFGGDYWMDWMGNLEVTAAMPGYPLGRVYYGRSSGTTFHPTIAKFIEAQELQKPFDIFTEWLVIQHVDEVMNFVTDQDGKTKMIVVSPSAASDVLGSGYDADQQKLQGYIDEVVASAKKEIGISDADIVYLPLFFDGSGMDWGARWTNPVNSIFVNGTFIIGNTDVPSAIKTDIETRFAALGIDVAWVDDADYHRGGGNVHCGTNIAKTPVCANFARCE